MEMALEVAGRNKSVVEQPPNSNWGPQVKLFLESAGISKPAPWCAAFVYFCIAQAAKELGVANPFQGIKYPALAFAYSAWGGEHDRIIKSRGEHADHEYPPGALVVFHFSHIGFILDTLGGGKVRTIEGNTNGAGSRDGGAVLVKDRKLHINDVVLTYGERQPVRITWELARPILQAGYEHLFGKLRPEERDGNVQLKYWNELVRREKERFDV
jgi:hypothetical protein